MTDEAETPASIGPHMLITHVYISRGVVSAWISTGRSAALVHRCGHMPYTGWFCTCSRGKRCGQLDALKALLPVEAIEAGARLVENGAAPLGGCVPGQPGSRRALRERLAQAWSEGWLAGDDFAEAMTEWTQMAGSIPVENARTASTHTSPTRKPADE